MKAGSMLEGRDSKLVSRGEIGKYVMFTIRIQWGKSLQGHIQNVSEEYYLQINCVGRIKNNAEIMVLNIFHQPICKCQWSD